MDYAAWINSFSDGLTTIAGQIAAYLPRILIAIMVVIGGWLIAKLVRAIGTRLVAGLDRLWRKLVLRTGLEQLQPRHLPARVVGEILFWVVILIFVAIAAQILGLGVFVEWVSALIAYVPVLAAGLLIVLAGFIVSALARDLVTATASSAALAARS